MVYGGVMHPDFTKQVRLALPADFIHPPHHPQGTAIMVKSKELLLMQDVWRTAYRKGTLDLDFQTKNGAVRARLQLYNAVRKQKAGEDLEDLELVHAAEQLEIVWIGETSIRLQKRADNDMMLGITKALGKQLEDFQDPDMLESGKRLLEELEGMGKEQEKQQAEVQRPAATPLPVVALNEPGPGPAPATEHVDNPFYGKRDA